jgi:hypothetical protein
MKTLSNRVKRLDRRFGRCLGCPVCGKRLDEHRRQMVIDDCLKPLSPEEMHRRIAQVLRIMPPDDKEVPAPKCLDCRVCGNPISEERQKEVVKAHQKPMTPEEMRKRVDEVFGLTSDDDQEDEQ